MFRMCQNDLKHLETCREVELLVYSWHKNQIISDLAHEEAKSFASGLDRWF